MVGADVAAGRDLFFEVKPQRRRRAIGMYRVLLTLIVVDTFFLAVVLILGATLQSPTDVNRHYLLGLFASMATCFIHCLVLFYLIGTGKEVREAAADVPGLSEHYVAWTRRQKARAFPAASFAIVLMVLAVLMGGEVHSRLLGSSDGQSLPLRGIPLWWIHVLSVGAAIVSSAWAFVVELDVVRENRRGIQLLNEKLARLEAEGA
jgi:amino acid transporter